MSFDTKLSTAPASNELRVALRARASVSRDSEKTDGADAAGAAASLAAVFAVRCDVYGDFTSVNMVSTSFLEEEDDDEDDNSSNPQTRLTNLALGVGSAPNTVQHAAPDAFATCASALCGLRCLLYVYADSKLLLKVGFAETLQVEPSPAPLCHVVQPCVV